MKQPRESFPDLSHDFLYLLGRHGQQVLGAFGLEPNPPGNELSVHKLLKFCCAFGNPARRCARAGNIEQYQEHWQCADPPHESSQPMLICEVGVSLLEKQLARQNCCWMPRMAM